MTPRCEFVKKDGTRCKRGVLGELTTCLFHTPHEQRVFTPPDELEALQRELKAVMHGRRVKRTPKRTELVLALTGRIAEIKQARAKQERTSWQPPSA